MANLTKKQNERKYLDEFKANYSPFPDGEISESEEPDFIISSPSGKVGIEVTQLYNVIRANGVNVQEQESLAHQLIQRAERKYQETDKSPFRVQVNFNLNPGLTNRKRDSLIEFLVAFVKAHKGQLPLIVEDNLPPEIGRIALYRFPGEEVQKWEIPYAGWIGKMTRQRIIEEVGKKEIHCEKYRNKAESIWLLLIADMHILSCSFNCDEIDLEHVYESGFDRVVLYEAFTGACYDFKLRKD